MTRDPVDGLVQSAVQVRSAIADVRATMYAVKAASIRGRRLIRVHLPSRDDHLIKRVEAKVLQTVSHELIVVRSRVSNALAQRAFKFAKLDIDETMGEAAVRAFIRALNDDTLAWSEDARRELRELLTIVAEERAESSLESLTEYLGDSDMAAALSQANERAVEWARDRVGNLITGVTDTTRDAINEMAATAIENGWTNRQLADQLEAAWEFSPERALMIARTEPTFAESAGTLAGYGESGVVEGKGWSAEDPCDVCQGNVDDGIIGLEDDFSSGDQAPPAHPNCKCAVYAGVLVGA